MTAPVDLLAEADALEAVVSSDTTGEWYHTASTSGIGRVIRERNNDYDIVDRVIPHLADLLVALRNRAMPLIRALREQLEQSRTSEITWLQDYQRKFREFEARIEALEAERDIWKERSNHYMRGLAFAWQKPVDDLQDPTPSEIAARVAEKRKELG